MSERTFPGGYLMAKDSPQFPFCGFNTCPYCIFYLPKGKKKYNEIMAKKYGSRWYHDKAVEDAKTLAKVRDNYTCQRCGKTKETNQIQGSHVYSVGGYYHLGAEVLNIKALCANCHMWWHAEPTESSEWFQKEFPERFEYLQPLKYDRSKRDWKEIRADLRKKLKALREL